MQAFSGSSLPLAFETLPLRPEPPAWVLDLFDPGEATRIHAQPGDHALSVVTGREFTLVAARHRDLPGESASDLSNAVGALYAAIAAELIRRDRHPVRIWNFVPDIQGAIEGAADRYMAFNKGRFSAYCDWFGEHAFQRLVPTSSAVGVSGDALWIYALAAETAGEPIENPRQVPSYRYSEQYGERPPCFARATRLGRRLFIGGTASILGEHSHHLDDVERQTQETFENISALVGNAACGRSRQPLDLLRSLRVHVRDISTAPLVRSIVADRVSRVSDVEFVQAPLCRRELLVEIEGVAEC